MIGKQLALARFTSLTFETIFCRREFELRLRMLNLEHSAYFGISYFVAQLSVMLSYSLTLLQAVHFCKWQQQSLISPFILLVGECFAARWCWW
jgi:hypothetical protein